MRRPAQCHRAQGRSSPPAVIFFIEFSSPPSHAISITLSLNNWHKWERGALLILSGYSHWTSLDSPKNHRFLGQIIIVRIFTASYSHDSAPPLALPRLAVAGDLRSQNAGAVAKVSSTWHASSLPCQPRPPRVRPSQRRVATHVADLPPEPTKGKTGIKIVFSHITPPFC